MGNARPEKGNIIKDIRNLFRLKKELNYTAIRDIINQLTLEKETKAIKDRILRGIKNRFEHKEEENSHKPVRVSNFWSNNYTEYESNSDRSKPLSTEEFLNKISQYLKGIIDNLKKSDNDEEHVMHSKTGNIEIIIDDEADKVIKGIFDSLKNIY